MKTCSPRLTQDLPNRKVEWTESTRTRLQDLAAERRLAFEALSKLHHASDPAVKRSIENAAKSQEYWESMLFEAGKLAWMSPQKLQNAGGWMANVLGQSLGVADQVRQPLVNMRRLVEGQMREVGIYEMMGQMARFSDQVRATGIKLSPEEFRKFVEEGLTPQRMSIYNSEAVNAALTQRYNTFYADMTAKGFTDSQLRTLLDSATEVSAQWDKVRAVAMAGDYRVGEMYNIGYMPREMTIEARRQLERAGAFVTDEASGLRVLAKSRNTWNYLPEDSVMAAKMLDILVEQLDDLVANPGDMAQFLSQRVTDAQLDLLVDSGVMSKLPMTSTEVAEFLSHKYKVPLTNADMWIHDPLAASNEMIKSLKRGAQESALVKQLQTEGVRAGWAVTGELVKNEPALYGGWKLLNDLPGINVPGGSTYVHPQVADHLNGIMRLAENPAEISNVGRILNWFRQTTAKQTLGNPIIGPAYLSGQLLSGISSTMGRGVGSIEYFASLVDIFNLSARGLDAFDNVKPFRQLDGKTVTHREFVAKTMRTFSHNILPGVNVAGDGAKFIDWQQLSPGYTRRQFERIRASANNGVKEFASELDAVLKAKDDAIFLPTLRMASMIDMATQLAIARGTADLGYGGVKKLVNDADQLLTGWSATRYSTWAEVTDQVKKAVPMFDDLGSATNAVSSVFPFVTWAMHNLPLQLRDMMRQPSRWVNYSRMHAAWNDARTDEDPILQGEMRDWERDKYGIVLRHDENSKRSVMLFSDGFDPRWGALTWMAKLAEGKDMSDIRDDIRGRTHEKKISEIIGKTYFSGLYKAVTGIDPLTGLKRDESPTSFKQFGGIEMSPWLASVLSMSPVLQSIDRLPIISGTRQVLDPRTGAVMIPAVDGWLGNQGSLAPKQLEGVEATLQVLGGKVRVIDRLANMKYTWRDTESTISDLRIKHSQEQKALQAAVMTGQIKRDSDSFRKREAALNRMVDVMLQLNYDLGRIKEWGIKNNVPSDEVMSQVRDMRLILNNEPLPGAEYLRQQLDEALRLKTMEK